MVFQLFQALFPFGGVIYTHSFICPVATTWCVGTYRDFRACAVSHWRYVAKPEAGSVMSSSQVRRFAGRMLEFTSVLRYYRDTCNPMWIKYESHAGDPRRLLDIVLPEYTRRTGNPVSGELQSRAVAYLTRKAQHFLYSTSQLSMFQSNHIQDGSEDGWKDWLSPESHQLITDILSEPLKEWGYLP